MTSDELNEKLKSYILNEMPVGSLIKDKADWTRTDRSYEGMVAEIRRHIWGGIQGTFPKTSADPMEMTSARTRRAVKTIKNGTGITCRSHSFWNKIRQIICENYGTKGTQAADDLGMNKPRKPVAEVEKPEQVAEVEKTTRLIITSQYTVFEETVVEVPVGYTPEDVKEVYVRWGKSAFGMSDDQLVTDLNVIYKRETHDDMKHPEWTSVNVIEENEDGTFDYDSQVEVISGDK